MHPASKVLRWILGAVVRRLTRGKYILCESRGQRALNGSVFLLVTGYRNGIFTLVMACALLW